MHAGHQQEPRGSNRRQKGKVTGISTPLALRRPWQILAVLAALFVPASGLIFAQSGFVPFSNSIIGLDVSPDDASIILVGTLNVPVPAGIYRSADGGHTWSRANVDLPPNTSIAAIRFDPQDGNRALATDGGVGNMLFISEDGGLNWRQEPSINQVLSPKSGVGRLFARIEEGQTVFYAGTRYDGVVRSVDGGLSWEWNGEGLTGNALRVRAFADKDGALYAGTHDGVWRLTLGAGSWQRVDLPAGIIARGMTILDGRLYVGTFASGLYLSDDGYNWIQDPSFPAGVFISDLIGSGQEVIVGTNVGLWTQSVPDWVRAPVNGALYINQVFRLASPSTFVGVTYAGTEQDGVLRTLDSGATFLSSAHITPLDPAELPRAPTPTPSVSPTVTETPPPTETPIPTETPTVTATHDPNAPTAAPTAACTPIATRDPNAPTDTPTATGTPTATRDPNAPTDTPTATGTPTATRDPNAPTDTPAAIGTPTATRDSDAPTDTPAAACTPIATPDPNAPTDTPTATLMPPSIVTGTPPSTSTTDDMPTSTPTAADAGEQPPPTATSTTVSPGNVNQNLTRIPPIWVGGAAVFFLLILVAGISVARDGSAGTDEL